MRFTFIVEKFGHACSSYKHVMMYPDFLAFYTQVLGEAHLCVCAYFTKKIK